MRKKNDILFVDYFDEWVNIYKVGEIREITLQKYQISSKFLRKNISNLRISDLDRRSYQSLLNKYAETHERQTTMDFHHQVKGCVQDMFHDGLIDKDPTYKAIIKGRKPVLRKKIKYLNQEELSRLVSKLVLNEGVNMDWLIMIGAKTGLRFGELLGLTPMDFDFKSGRLTVNKTWAYKKPEGGFDLTKNKASIRTIMIDWQIIAQFSQIIQGMNPDEPIFVEKLNDGTYKRVFNSTYINRLSVLCREADVPEISMHALRHTHASILLASDISIQSIAQRLGHASTATTQETYLHIIKELEQKDEQKMMSALSSIS